MADELVIEDDKQEFPCPDCDFVAASEGGLTQHVNAKHPAPDADSKDVGADVDEDDEDATTVDDVPGIGETTNPNYGEPREDGLIGVDDEYPTPARFLSEVRDDGDA